MNTNMTGFRFFYLCVVEFWMKVASALEGLGCFSILLVGELPYLFEKALCMCEG